MSRESELTEVGRRNGEGGKEGRGQRSEISPPQKLADKKSEVRTDGGRKGEGEGGKGIVDNLQLVTLRLR